ncbi:hypothetical protein MNBD_GAMMA11-2269 [hydrothermal vent metagenome]|uniref:DUF4123 domain-containing protein n=1 Tax=hydrothermal vent metagenome TaxID=652676 RepID=A0A3B0WW00_9ZZZZ
MIPAEMKTKTCDYLFSFTRSHLFAVIDGASVPGLLEAIKKNNTQYCCLLSGKLSSELAQVAPYLVKLEKKSPLTEWLLDGWGTHSGIYCIIDESVPFMDVRKHFRSVQIVKNYDSKCVFFRYYDPRVMNVYLPTCTSNEAKQMFGPIAIYLLEGERSNSVKKYSLMEGEVNLKEYLYIS